MCGLAGIWDPKRRSSAEALTHLANEMARQLVHRGPDDAGVWVDAEAGVAFGFRRLSILDLSQAGHQPMVSAGGRYVIVFNGEIYNHVEIRARLYTEDPTLRFRGHSDTETILAAVERWGLVTSLERFNGMFAFAIWDRQEHSLSLARDRMGEKPLYYGWQDGVLLFGSELKALRVHPVFRGEINRDALALYLRHNCIPAPYSIYQNIFKLMPGEYLTLRDGDGVPTPYWSLKQVVEDGVRNRFTGSDEDAIEEMESLLIDSVDLRRVADVPVGVFLSGGIDSSAISLLMQRLSNTPIKTFSIGFEEESFNEADDARAVSKHLRSEHTEMFVTSADVLSVIPKLTHFYDEPFADSSQIPTYLVAQLARNQVTVSLSGDGGDEVFGGYNRHVWSERMWRRMARLPLALRRSFSGLVQLLTPSQWDRLFSAGRPLLPDIRLPGDKIYKLSRIMNSPSELDLYRTLSSHWAFPERIVVGATEPTTSVTNRSGWPKNVSFTELMMFFDSVTFLPDDILVKVDRATMAHGLEARVPLLDHRLIEFAWRLPVHMKVRNGTGKWILRQWLANHLPARTIQKPKMGFGLPLGRWLRTDLRHWCEALLDETVLKNDGFFEPALIRQRWKEHLGGSEAWSYHLWDVLMFQAWLSEHRTPAISQPAISTEFTRDASQIVH